MDLEDSKEDADELYRMKHPDPGITESVLRLRDQLIEVRASEKWDRRMNVITTPQKNALLIGLKHPNPEMNTVDVKVQMLRMKKYLMELRGFPESNITLMIEGEGEEENRPTYSKWRVVIFRLLETCNQGDTLFIHLIAHGCSHGNILDADKEHVKDSYFRGVILRALLWGCNLTFLSDCLIDPLDKCPCPRLTEEEKLARLFESMKTGPLTASESAVYRTFMPTNLSSVDILIPAEKEDVEITQDDNDFSRAILLMPFARHSKLTASERNRNRRHKPCSRRNKTWNVSEIFFAPPSQHTLYGGFTNAILDVIEETHGQVTNLELAQKAMDKLGGQIPSLRCSHHRHAYASFVC